MKIYAPSTALFALASLTALSSADDTTLATSMDDSNSGSGPTSIFDGSGSDSAPGTAGSGSSVAFNATDDEHDTIKTAVNLVGAGAKIQLCPSGDCVNGQVITLSMSRLQEFDTSTKPFVQEAKNFNSLSATWSAFTPILIDGVDAITSSFVATFKVDKAQSLDTFFNLTAVIYQANGTAMNGNQTIDVPAGALKFSVDIKNWPFQDTANRLRFGVELKAQGKNKAERDPGTKQAKGGKTKDIDRVDMGEGMYMDAPTLAVVDGVNVAINASVEPGNKKMVLVWIFPSFRESLYYDPVMGSEDPSASMTTNSTTAPSSSTGGSGSTTPTTDGSGSTSHSTAGSGTATTHSTAGSGSSSSSPGSNATPKPTLTDPAPSATPSTPTPSETTTATNTNAKTSGASVLGAALLGALVAVAVGGTLFL